MSAKFHNRLGISFVAAAATLCGCQPQAGPQRVQTITAIYQTTSDDKDWDTHVIDRLVIHGKDYATVDCCHSNKKFDHWGRGETNKVPLNILVPMTRDDLRDAQIAFGMLPNGDDRWWFIASLRVTYDHGDPDQWNFGEFYLKSDSQYTSRTFSIPH